MHSLTLSMLEDNLPTQTLQTEVHQSLETLQPRLKGEQTHVFLSTTQTSSDQVIFPFQAINQSAAAINTRQQAQYAIRKNCVIQESRKPASSLPVI